MPHSFAGESSDGASPYGSLVLSGTTLYGMTEGVGSSVSSVFQINADGTGLKLLHAFHGSDGLAPYGDVALSGSTLYVADTDSHTLRLGFHPAAPSITDQPGSQTASVGSTVTFSVTATGQPAPDYHWSFDGTAIAGADGATLTLPSVQTSSAGTYTVSVSNAYGSVTSVPTTLTVTAGSSASGASASAKGSGDLPPWFAAGLLLLAAARAIARSGRS